MSRHSKPRRWPAWRAKSGMLPVGVFRDAPLRAVADIATQLGLARGSVAWARKTPTMSALCAASCHAIAKSGPRSASAASRFPRAAASGCCSTTATAAPGERFDWSLVAGHPELPRAVVAGGIGPRNARAARRLGAYAIDVGSPVDAAPGRQVGRRRSAHCSTRSARIAASGLRACA